MDHVLLFLILFLSLFIFERERDRERERGREREIDLECEQGSSRERIPIRLCAVSAEPDTGLEPMNHEIMTLAEIKS